MKRVSANVDQMQAFVVINNAGMMIKCRRECKELIDKGVCETKDLFGILGIVSINVINHMMLVNIQAMKTVSARKLS